MAPRIKNTADAEGKRLANRSTPHVGTMNKPGQKPKLTAGTSVGMGFPKQTGTTKIPRPSATRRRSSADIGGILCLTGHF